MKLVQCKVRKHNHKKITMKFIIYNKPKSKEGYKVEMNNCLLTNHNYNPFHFVDIGPCWGWPIFKIINIYNLLEECIYKLFNSFHNCGIFQLCLNSFYYFFIVFVFIVLKKSLLDSFILVMPMINTKSC